MPLYYSTIFVLLVSKHIFAYASTFLSCDNKYYGLENISVKQDLLLTLKVEFARFLISQAFVQNTRHAFPPLNLYLSILCLFLQKCRKVLLE